MLRENKRMLDKAIRDLDRERMALQNQEKKLIVEIKKTAKQGQMVRCVAGCCFRHLSAWLAKRDIHGEQLSACWRTGCCQGDGKVAGAEPTRRDQDVWLEVAAAGCVSAYCGARPLCIIPRCPSSRRVQGCGVLVCTTLCLPCADFRGNAVQEALAVILSFKAFFNVLHVPSLPVLALLDITTLDDMGSCRPADAEVDTGHGRRNARRHQGHGRHEQADEPASADQDHARLREAK